MNITENKKIDGTMLLIKCDFDVKNPFLFATAVEIIDDIKETQNQSAWEREYMVINCFKPLYDYTYNENKFDFIFPKKEVKSGDTVYVVTASDGDCYGQFILGVFTEKPDKEDIIKKYVEYQKAEDEYCDMFEDRVESIFEIVVS